MRLAARGLARPSRHLRPRPGWLLTAALVSLSPAALGHARGIVATDCGGCHGSAAAPPQLTVTSVPETFGPGEAVTLTLTIRAASIRVGGAYITTGGVGTLQALANEGLAKNGNALTHTAPKAASGDAVTFRFGWQAPSSPGAVDFGVAALSGNGNNASSGDAAGVGEFQWVFGCSARSFYVDLDRDGYGSKRLGEKLACEGAQAPVGYASKDGDCDENDEKVHPGATEICDNKDDDCNGQVDEGAPPVEMWPDRDGDGFFAARTGTSKLGCGNVSGYAASGGDCDDLDPKVSPAAIEVCNEKDDDCDGEIDERVRPVCGLGWCSRYSPTCDAADCVPGPPRAETCNSFDDDCDGEDDNGACPAGSSCVQNQCLASGSSDPEPAPAGGSGGTALPGVSGNGGAFVAGSSGTGAAATPPAAPAEKSGGCGLSPAAAGSGRSAALSLSTLLLALLRWGASTRRISDRAGGPRFRLGRARRRRS